MRSVADVLRVKNRARLMAMTPAERVALALALGKRDREIFRAACGITTEEARRILERQRQTGRRRSRCIEELLG